MKKKLLHTPEGVRDIYGSECARKNVLEDRLHDVLKLYGYSDIQTPSYEFFDIFNKERGSVPSNEMYKFFDRNGNTMVLRPDMTPAIARTAAKYFEESILVQKLCYKGNTFINNSSYQGRLKETTQIGAELIGDSSLEADAEIIAMVIECLLNAGLTEFQVEIGNVAYFKGILEEAGIDGETEEELVELILNKNYFGVEDVLAGKSIPSSFSEILLQMPRLFGTFDILNTGAAAVQNVRSLEAIERLKNLYHLLRVYGYEQYVTFDLGMLSKHAYYTGVIFNAYTYGTGDSVVKGGRYDKLIGQFGKEKASIGFSITVDQLMAALHRQKIEIPLDSNGDIILYSQPYAKNAISAAKALRKAGNNVNLLQKSMHVSMEEYESDARAKNFGKIYVLQDEEIAEIHHLKTGERTQCRMSDLIGNEH